MLIVLVVIGFQLLIHVNGFLKKALSPRMIMMMMMMMIIIIMMMLKMMTIPIVVTLVGIVTVVSP